MMERAVRALDAALRVAWGIRAPDDPRALFRLRLVRAAHAISLPDQPVPAGAVVVDLHLWNERLPRLPDGGPDLAWGARTVRAVVVGLRAVAREMARDPALAAAQALYAPVPSVSPLQGAAARRILARLGFTIWLTPPPRSSALRIADRVWAALLVRAVQPAAHAPAHGAPMEVWMSAATLLSRYGPAAAAEAYRLS